jgi:hypothetical protein
VKQNDGEAKSSEMQDGITALPNVNSELALAELEALACALLSVLLAFLGAGVAGEEALALQLLAQFNVELQQGAGNAHL